MKFYKSVRIIAVCLRVWLLIRKRNDNSLHRSKAAATRMIMQNYMKISLPSSQCHLYITDDKAKSTNLCTWIELFTVNSAMIFRFTEDNYTQELAWHRKSCETETLKEHDSASRSTKFYFLCKFGSCKCNCIYIFMELRNCPNMYETQIVMPFATASIWNT